MIKGLKTISKEVLKREIKVNQQVFYLSCFKNDSSKKIINLISISDVLKITPQNLRQAPRGGMYLDLIQIKTKKSITVGIIDHTVLEFLRRDFPQKTNASVFNKKIKELCRLAGIDQVIKGNKMS